MQPPKCPTCHKTEWRHTCLGKADPPFTKADLFDRVAAMTNEPNSAKPRKPRAGAKPKTAESRVLAPPSVGRTAGPIPATGAEPRKRAPKGTGFDKKSYMREYQRRRRAELKAEKELK